MRVAKYWVSESATAQDPKGEVYALKRWGHSNLSLAEAKRQAAQKLRQAVDKISTSGVLRSQYDKDYANSLRREELIQEITDTEARLIGAITRNRYGALVLNTARLLIADIDLQQPGLMATLKALFSSKRARQATTLERIERFRKAHPEYTLRIYETHSGYRVMIVNQPFEPSSEATRQVFEQLGCDPLYVKLCRAQDSFRARLTPKPWRCNSGPPPNLFPRETTAAQHDFERWRQDYERASDPFAVCTRVDGQHAAPPAAVERLLQLHDQHVLRPGLPLA